MKNLQILISLLLLVLSTKSQSPIKESFSFNTRKKQTCKGQKDISASDVFKLITIQKEQDFTLSIMLDSVTAATVNSNPISIKNITDGKTKFPDKLVGKEMVFNFTKPNEAAVKVYLQLSQENNNVPTCYEIFQLELHNEVIIKTPKLDLSPFKFTPKLCEACKPIGNSIVYYFDNNSIKNKKDPESTKRDFKEDYLRKRWFRLPRVGEELTFEVKNVNSFKYDVTLTDETISFNTDAPSTLTNAFIPKGIDATAANAVKDKKPFFKALMEEVHKSLASKIVELRNAGDCVNLCSEVSLIIDQIEKYFIDNYHYYASGMPLEQFLLKQISELYPAKTDEDDANKLKGYVSDIYSFRASAISTYSYRIPQIKNVDQYLFRLNILPKSNVNAGTRVLNQEIAVDILGGFKVDVSSGLFFTSLIDDQFRLVGDSTVIGGVVTDRRNIVIKEVGNKTDFGVSSFFHFYPKITPHLNASFTLGVGMSLTEKPKLRYLSGVSLLAGKTNRLALTYGAAMGYVDELSTRYDNMRDPLGNLYVSNNDKSVDIKKTFRIKPFFSLSYSIPIIKKKEEVKAAPASDPKPANDKPTSSTTKETPKS